MKVITVTTQKGGAGKTTLSGHLGIEFSNRGFLTVIVDSDPQGNLKDWWNAREAEQPVLMSTSFSQLPDALKQLAAAGVDFVVIDTPPRVDEQIREVVQMADLVLIPSKPGPHDLRAVIPTLALIQDLGKPMLFVVNEATVGSQIARDAVKVLEQHGVVAPTIHDRIVFAEAMIDGHGAQEVDADSKASFEIFRLCNAILKQMGFTKTRKGAA